MPVFSAVRVLRTERKSNSHIYIYICTYMCVYTYIDLPIGLCTQEFGTWVLGTSNCGRGFGKAYDYFFFAFKPLG